MGGSVRIPAAWCGIVGLKPGLGRIPMDVLPGLFDTLSHHGPLARSVDDARLFLSVTQGPDDADIMSVTTPLDLSGPTPGDVPGGGFGDPEAGGAGHADTARCEGDFARHRYGLTDRQPPHGEILKVGRMHSIAGDLDERVPHSPL